MTFVSDLNEFAASALIELQEKKPELIKQVLETGQPGEITLKLKFNPDGIERIQICPEVSVKMPKRVHLTRVAFVDDKNNFVDKKYLTAPQQTCP